MAARDLFNSKGYSATSLNEIAASIGISQGNLTYHFPSKSDLAERLHERATEQARARRSNLQPGEIADDYVEHLLFAMRLTWSYRFLLRDRIHFADQLNQPDIELEADFRELRGLLERISANSMFRRDAVDDLEVLARSIWIMSRYWIDYLRDVEGLKEISWAHQERGIRQHFALLMPCLTASAKRTFEAALRRAQSRGDAPRSVDAGIFSDGPKP